MEPWHYPRSPASIGLMLRFARRWDVPPERLLAGARLSLQDLDDPDCAISIEQELKVIRNLFDAAPEAAHCGLEIGLSYQLSAYGLLGYGLLSSASGEAALALAQRFMPLTYTLVAIAIMREGPTTRLTFEARVGQAGADLDSAGLERFLVERAMGAASRVLRDVVGTDVQLTTFELRWPAGRGAGTKTVMGAAVRHACSRNAISFDHQVLRRPLPQANPLTAALCERMCGELLSRRNPRVDTAAFVRQHLAGRPFKSPPTIDEYARMLNTSERTLKRRLKGEGTSFRALSSIARLDRANALIREGRLSIAQIADDLGFGDPGSFSQAYKRWTGMRPSEARLAGRPW